MPSLYANIKSGRKAKESQISEKIKSAKANKNAPKPLLERLSYLWHADQIVVRHALTPEVEQALDIDPSAPLSLDIIVIALSTAEVLFQAEFDKCRVILRLSNTLVVKIVPTDEDAGAECAALHYLHTHAAELPVPTPLGLLKIEKRDLLFMSYVPGEDIDNIWTSLQPEQKRDLAAQVESFFTSLRALRPAPAQLWGRCDGQGCVDQRRRDRHAEDPITNADQFKDFYFSKPLYGSKAWIKFLRNLYDLPDANQSSNECVFTHGDLRLANIRVIRNEDGSCKLSGVIDWELSGWYPDWWESVKLTNCIGPSEKKNWLLYIPSNIAPSSYPVKWLIT